jgi:hypothetical protein
MKAASILALLAVSVVAAACTAKSDPPPPFEAGPGATQTKTELNYPDGPYGIGVGSTIPNLQFIGYVNAVADNSQMQVIQFSDFYNPHGLDKTYVPESPDKDDRLFPAGSQYGAGNPKPTVIAIDVASVWCGPCNAEAKCVLPVHKRTYAPCGGGFFLQLQDGPTPGKAATPKNLYNWTVKSYKEDFPTAIDPEERLISQVAPQEAFPVNVLVRTDTMKIVEAIAGVPDASYWKKYESLLADPTCPSKQPTCSTDADCAAIPGTACTTSCPNGTITCIPHQCQASGCKNQ